MTVDVRRSSRRSLVVEKKTKAENAAPSSKRQPKKKPSIVDVVKDQAQTEEKKNNVESVGRICQSLSKLVGNENRPKKCSL